MALDQQGEMGIGTDAAEGASAGMMFGPIGAIVGGVIGAGVGLVSGLMGSNARAKAEKEEIAQLELRRKQMEYDARRQTLQTERAAQMASSVALSNATLSGASTGQAGRTGSAVGGSAGQIQGQTGVETNAIYQNLQIGEQLFTSKERQVKAEDTAQTDQGIAQMAMAIGKMGSPMGKAFGQVYGGFSGGQDTSSVDDTMSV